MEINLHEPRAPDDRTNLLDRPDACNPRYSAGTEKEKPCVPATVSMRVDKVTDKVDDKVKPRVMRETHGWDELQRVGAGALNRCRT
jgi:hypothetical protein